MLVKKKKDTNYIGQLGASWVSWIVEGVWGCGLEVVSAHNDNSLDALIFLKKRDNSRYAGPTGDIVFAQIKTGYVRRLPGEEYKLNLGKSYIQTHRMRWLSFPGPVIMINVIPPSVTGGEPIAYWADLRAPEAYEGGSSIVFDTKRKFDPTRGKSSLFNLCWKWAEVRQLPTVRSPRQVAWSSQNPSLFADSTRSLHKCARKFYCDWKNSSKQSPERFAGVLVTNRGWRHMRRIGRTKSRMFQSLILLPAASSILEEAGRGRFKRLTSTKERILPSGKKIERYYEGVTARVTFFERQEAVVRVVVEKTIEHCLTAVHCGPPKETRTLFSVYEIARTKQFS